MDYEKNLFESNLFVNYSEAFKACYSLYEFCEKVIYHKTSIETPFQEISLFFLTKSFKSFWAIIELSKMGFGEDALILGRSLFENAINYLYISKDPEKRTDLYMKHDCIGSKRYLNICKNSNTAIPNEDIVSQEVENNYQEVKKDYKGDIWWHDKKLKDMAIEVGLEETYNLIYPLHSEFVHSGIKAMKYYIHSEDEKVIVNYGPSENFVDNALISNFNSLVRVLDTYINKIGLPYEKELQAVIDEGAKLFIQQKPHEHNA